MRTVHSRERERDAEREREGERESQSERERERVTEIESQRESLLEVGPLLEQRCLASFHHHLSISQQAVTVSET